MTDKDRDIQDVMREEKSRGRKPVDTDIEREARERDAAILKILERRDREGLKQILLLYYTQDEVKKKLRLYDATFGSD